LTRAVALHPELEALTMSATAVAMTPVGTSSQLAAGNRPSASFSRLYAHLYNGDASGFAFDDVEKFNARVRQCRDRFGFPVDEFEIRFHDGTPEDAELWGALKPCQSEISTWFDDVGPLELQEKAALYVLVEFNGYRLRDALDILDDAIVFEGTLTEYVDEYIDSTGMLDSIPENLRYYFDMEIFTRDMELNGDVTGFRFAGRDWVIERTRHRRGGDTGPAMPIRGGALCVRGECARQGQVSRGCQFQSRKTRTTFGQTYDVANSRSRRRLSVNPCQAFSLAARNGGILPDAPRFNIGESTVIDEKVPQEFLVRVSRDSQTAFFCRLLQWVFDGVAKPATNSLLSVAVQFLGLCEVMDY